MPIPNVQPPAIEITSIGGPTALITIDGVRFLTDPTFDPAGKSYSVGKVTLKKDKGPAIAAEEIGKVDAVLLSHDEHPDNLDSSGRRFLVRAPQVLTTPSGASRLGNGAIGMRNWESRTITTPQGRHIRVTATPARHGPVGIEKIVGEVTGFVLTLEETREDLVYVTGDTVWYEGTAEVAKRFRPRAVLLFAGAAKTRGPFHLTMNANDAIETATAFPKAAIIPVHHEGWAHFTESQQDLAMTFAALGHSGRLREVTPGKKILLPPPPEVSADR